MEGLLRILSLLMYMQIWTLSDSHVCFKEISDGICSKKINKNMTEEECCARSKVVATYPTVERVDQDGGGRWFRCTPCEGKEINVVDGEWGKWTHWSECSVTCESGYKHRQRLCDSPKPANGGRSCSNSTDREEEMKICEMNPCPVDGEWGSWGCWSDCNTTCGKGVRSHGRQCDSPAPQHGGKYCVGSDSEHEECNMKICPVHGNWAPWLPWFPCDHTCGGGYQFRVRLCDEPSPSNGGEFCPGEDRQNRICNTKSCPVDGEWGAWSAYSSCSRTCGDGTKTRRRQCEGQQHGGASCPGKSFESLHCKKRECPIHGRWSGWSAWSQCSVTCEHGKLSRTRSCDQPRPEYGGNQCPGESKEVKQCDTGVAHCPIHGGWSPWTHWRSCSARRCSRSPGYNVRVRYCNRPVPEYNGEKCHGDPAQRKLCYNNKGCRVNGEWCPWSKWAHCQFGRQTRLRRCKCPEPSNGGTLCMDSRGRPSDRMIDRPRACVKEEVVPGCQESGSGGSGDGAAGDDEDCLQNGSGGGGGSGSGSGAGLDAE